MPHDPSVQYDASLAKKYSGVERLQHPQNFLPYATWLAEITNPDELVGDISEKRILDFACGSGVSSRLLAERDAKVVGVDISPEMIAIAREEEVRRPLGVTYHVADCSQPALRIEDVDDRHGVQMFDMVTAAFLFNYASTKQELANMLINIQHRLGWGGQFVALTTPPNPIIPRFVNASHSTEWIDEPFAEGSRFRLFIYDLEGNDVCNFVCHYWSRGTYEDLLLRLGFNSVKWVRHTATPELKRFRNWRVLEKNNCSIVLTARKN